MVPWKCPLPLVLNSHINQPIKYSNLSQQYTIHDDTIRKIRDKMILKCLEVPSRSSSFSSEEKNVCSDVVKS